MPRYVPLRVSQHQGAGYTPSGYGFAQQQSVVPLVIDDLPELIVTMPAAFVKQGEGGFELVGLQSFEPQQNMYVHTNGRWIGGYRPAMYRAYPFRLMRETASQQWILCVDEIAQGFTPQAGEGDMPFFDEAGEASQPVKNVLGFLQNLEKSRTLTQKLVTQLAEADLIVPWKIKVAADPDNPTPLQGLFHVDEVALRALPGDQLSALAQSGALSLAYSQLLSERRLSVVQKLYKLRHDALAQQTEKVDLEELFNDGDEDISFNFDS